MLMLLRYVFVGGTGSVFINTVVKYVRADSTRTMAWNRLCGVLLQGALKCEWPEGRLFDIS